MYNSYSPTYTTSSPADGTAFAVVFIGMLVFLIILYVVTAIFTGMIFKKAGVESWKAWVPVYNMWVFNELGGQKGWLALFYLVGAIPLIGWIGSTVAFVFSAMAAYRIGLNFGKEGAFVLLFIFLGPVWIIWLAVDKTAVWRPGANQQAVPAGPTSTPVASDAPAQK